MYVFLNICATKLNQDFIFDFVFQKGIRKLIKKRQNVENIYKRRDVIEDYKNYGSEAYAPLTRHGYFPDRNSENYVVKNRYLDTYQGKNNQIENMYIQYKSSV